MRFAALACLLLFISIELAPGQVPDERTDENKNPKKDSKRQDQRTQQVISPPPIQTVAPQVSRAGEIQRTEGRSPVLISTASPFDVRAEVQKDWMDRLGWIFAGALVVIGGFGIWYARKTLKAIEGQLSEIIAAGRQTGEMIKHAGAQSVAAGHQVRISELSMIAGNRAYVHYAGFKWHSYRQTGSETIFWRVRPSWKNSGNTPSRNLHIFVKYELRDSPLPDNFEYTVEPLRTPALIPPKSEIESAYFNIFGDDLVAVQEGRKHFYVWGVARYRDVFPETAEHVTKFCVRAAAVTNYPKLYWDSGTNPVEIRFTTHGWHNCADEDCDRPTI